MTIRASLTSFAAFEDFDCFDLEEQEQILQIPSSCEALVEWERRCDFSACYTVS